MNGSVNSHEVEVIFISNEANAQFDNQGVLTSALNPGRVVFFTKVTTKLPDGQNINLYSDVMAIEIVDSGIDDEDKEKTIWQEPWFYVAGISAVTAVSGAVWFVLRKYKKNNYESD